MAENEINQSEEETLEAIVTTPYKYGFTTDVDTEEFEKGLSQKIVKKISAKKKEPEFLLKFREKAFASWEKMQSPAWSYLSIPEIDYDKIDRLRGMDISIVTTAKTNQEGFFLLKYLGMPFQEVPGELEK